MATLAKRTMLVLGITSVLVLPALIAVRNYRAAMLDFESTPAAEISRHVEQAGIAQLEQVSFLTQQGQRITGWYVPSRNRAAIIVTHGTNSDRSSMLAETRILSAAGFGVLAFDWPGLGASEGPVRWGLEAQHALTAATDWLSSQPDIDSRLIGAVGFSMGGFILAQVAASDTRLRALVFEATPANFMDYIHLGHSRWGWLSFFPARYAVRAAGVPLDLPQPDVLMSKLARPVLFVGGDQDVVVPLAMTQALFAAALAPKQLWVARGSGHGDYANTDFSNYHTVLTTFFQQWLVVSPVN